MTNLYLQTLTALTDDSRNPIGMLGMMISANNFVKLDERGSIQFKFKGSRKVNTVIIRVNANDYFDMEFWKVGRTNFKQVGETITDIPDTALRGIFEEKTGLYTHLTRSA